MYKTENWDETPIFMNRHFPVHTLQDTLSPIAWTSYSCMRLIQSSVEPIMIDEKLKHRIILLTCKRCLLVCWPDISRTCQVHWNLWENGRRKSNWGLIFLNYMMLKATENTGDCAPGERQNCANPDNNDEETKGGEGTMNRSKVKGPIPPSYEETISTGKWTRCKWKRFVRVCSANFKLFIHQLMRCLIW